MAANCKNIFYLGKGGTGKTTISALTAIALCERGKKVALFSMDPAHNLADIFDIPANKPLKFPYDTLVIEEINISYWVETYLKSIEDKILKSYKYLTAINLEKHLKTIRYSPGLEEYALIYAYDALLKKYSNYQYLIFDMPPTALALRFFNLPQLTLVWLDQLVSLRHTILKNKKIINTVHKANTKNEHDNILNQLEIMQKQHSEMLTALRNQQKTICCLVLNEDELSLSESTDIYKNFADMGITIASGIVNKYQNNLNREVFDRKFSGCSFSSFPLLSEAIIGLQKLKKHANHQSFQSYIDSIL